MAAAERSYGWLVTPPGHLAVGYLVARGSLPRLGSSVAPALLGALLPDLMDKPALWMGFTPYGRTVGHSAIVWALFSLAWVVAFRRRASVSASIAGFVVLGGLSHLAIDLVDDVIEGLERSGYVFSAWFGWPFTNPDMWNVRSPHLLAPMAYAVTTLEVATVAACLWHVARHRG